MVSVRKGLRGHFAVRSADGRGLGVRHLASRLGRHLGVAGDDDVIGVAGRRIRVWHRPCARAVADACRAGAGVAFIAAVAAARGRHLAAGDLDVVARAVHTAADTGSTRAAHGFYRAAGDLDVSGTSFVASADACAAVAAALSGEGAVLALVVLDGQGALRLIAVLFEARIGTAALQLVFAVQLDGGIVAALHGDGGIALPDRAVTAAIPFGLAADVNFQVVEGDVHIAAGGVDGDGMLLRLAGDDGVALIFYEFVIALLDVVRPFVVRSHGDVAVGDVPPGRVGRDAGAYHDARDDGGGYAPPECAFQSHSLSSFGLLSFENRLS